MLFFVPYKCKEINYLTFCISKKEPVSKYYDFRRRKVIEDTMNKGVSGLLILLQKPYRLCFVLTGLFLFFAGTSFHSSVLIKDYIETTGEVINLEETIELRQGNRELRYNYDLIWYVDGEEYEKHFEKQLDAREEGEVTIWIRQDNRDAVFSNSAENYDAAYRFSGIAIVAGLAGMLFYGIERSNRYESRIQTIERLEDTKLYSILVFILSLIGVAIPFILEYQEFKNGEYVNPVLLDFSIACGILAVGCLIVFSPTKIKLKKYE